MFLPDPLLHDSALWQGNAVVFSKVSGCFSQGALVWHGREDPLPMPEHIILYLSVLSDVSIRSMSCRQKACVRPGGPGSKTRSLTAAQKENPAKVNSNTAPCVLYCISKLHKRQQLEASWHGDASI